MKKLLIPFAFLVLHGIAIAQPQEWKLGIQLWTFHISTFQQALVRADSCGIHYIEIYPGQKFDAVSNDVVGPLLPESKMELLFLLLKTHHLAITSYGVVTCEKSEEWEPHFQFAKALHIPVITAEPNKKDLDLVNALGEKYQIKIALHDHPKPSGYWHPDSVLQAMHNHPYIGACADIGHWTRNGLNIVECLQKLEGHIFGLHFKDVAPEIGSNVADHVFYVDTILGKGICNIPLVLKELKRQHFNGYFAMEHEVNWQGNVKDIILNRQYFLSQIQQIK